MGEERETTFFQTHFMHQRQAKIGPGPKKTKKIKNICEIILNTPNVPDGKVPSCTADPSPHAEYCTFLEGAVEQAVRIDKPPHRAASLSPSTPWGQCHHRHRPQQHSGSAGTSLPSKQVGSPKKKPQNPHPRDLVMSLGLGNQANEEARAKISNFCQIPGKAHCNQ